MKSLFEKYLIQKGLSINTSSHYNKFIEKNLLKYLQGLSLSIEEFDYQQLMTFIRYRKKGNLKAKTINLEIKKISYYLDFKGLGNVAQGVRVKGEQRRVPHDLLSEKELDDIYQKFPESRNYWTHEDTLKIYHLILGLRIYQGLQEQELKKLEIGHLQLEKGKIYVPSTKRTNRRILELKPFQIMPLHEYLLIQRPTIADQIEGNYLFHAKRLERGMSRIKALINRNLSQLKSMAQIRSSVITNWLRYYNLREVQYMCGHKCVSSTERYREDKLEDLQKELTKYHPMNNR